MAHREPRVLVFACNWNAHQSLDQAGAQRLSLPAGVRPLKVECLGQIGSGVILKAFEKGADGVMLVGCTPEECRYQFGSRRAAELCEQVRELASLMGLGEERLQFLQVGAGDGVDLLAKVQDFVDRLAAQTGEPLRWQQSDTTTEGAAGS